MMSKGPVTILLSGAPGTGKSTLQHHAPAFFRPRLGETAGIGTDEVYQMFDPDWALPYSAERAQLVQQTCCQLALHFFAHHFRCVLIAGNALYTPTVVQAYWQALAPVSQVYHFTLEADHATVVARVQQRGDLDAHPPVWLAEWQAHIRTHYAPWTRVIDATRLTVEQTLGMISDQLINSTSVIF